jgi:hypothetical protein
MTDQNPIATIRSARRIFHASLGAALLLAVLIVVYMALTGNTFQSSIVVKAMVGVLGGLIIVPGLRAMNVQCPACHKPFHARPIQALMPHGRCGQCGFPDGDPAKQGIGTRT